MGRMCRTSLGVITVRGLHRAASSATTVRAFPSGLRTGLVFGRECRCQVVRLALGALRRRSWTY